MDLSLLPRIYITTEAYSELQIEGCEWTDSQMAFSIGHAFAESADKGTLWAREGRALFEVYGVRLVATRELVEDRTRAVVRPSPVQDAR